MQILSVTLKNFKAHSDRHVAFQLGTNAICGENGAGKTSILEAIAWVLFNHRGAYKVEDLIRDGANSAQATVAFVSRRDARTYEVQRCTTRGYILYDPQLGQRLDYKHIEEEILPWLRQHLGVAPSTDLARLFANTIGVPQGTFTADFQKTPEDRKKVFDSILKVEEYKQTSQALLSLERYGKAQSEQLSRDIATYEEELTQLEPTQTRQQTLQHEIQQDEDTLAALTSQLTALQAEKDRVLAIAQQVQQLDAERTAKAAQRTAQQGATAQLQQLVEQSAHAVEICQKNAGDHQQYLTLDATLKTLRQRLKHRQAIAAQRDQQHKTLAQQHTVLTRLTVQLESVQQAADALTALKPHVQQQAELEQQVAAHTAKLQQLTNQRVEVQALAKQQATHQKQQTTLAKTLAHLRSLAPVLDRISPLEQQRDRLQTQLSRIAAAQQFEGELRLLVQQSTELRDRHATQVQDVRDRLQALQQSASLLAVEAIAAIEAALTDGQALTDDLLNTLAYILDDLAEQTAEAELQAQLNTTQQQLRDAYRQQADHQRLAEVEAQHQTLAHEQQQLEARLEALRLELKQEPQAQAALAEVQGAIARLDNPRGRAQVLEQQVQQGATLQTQQQQAQQAVTQAEQALSTLATQLAEFDTLEQEIDQQQQQQAVHQPGYLAVLQQQQAAQQHPALVEELQRAIAQQQQLDADYATLEQRYQAIAATHDPQQWQQVETQYGDVRSQCDRLTGALPQQRKLLTELEQRVQALQTIAEKCDRAQEALKHRDRVKRFISFARKAYKEAGPRITERYLTTISKEADRLFRELMNRPNVALEWSRDYEIIVSEGAHKRRFVNLSGGEQMCSALAVRLALLRTLADIDVAFFDEPTTNMDRQRRQSLAEAIANIKTFQQIFVISHDDTFEQVTENVILIQRE
ncbi:MAG: SMC family ATPase [Kaiparowitsia implicata GSE-PSE-MK54-09C]|jgi:exonuclease SbcC|nr:SMC family ATPase [Kaiparowitsia implicata GSE-PSE-MK54-09C]